MFITKEPFTIVAHLVVTKALPEIVQQAVHYKFFILGENNKGGCGGHGRGPGGGAGEVGGGGRVGWG